MPFAVYQFGDFSLDCGKFELRRNQRRLKIERKPLELLILMVSKHGQVVTRDEIAERLWGHEVFVDIEHGINTAIRKIRQSLGDNSDLPLYVQTISGSGYRFIASVTQIEPELTEPAQPSLLSIASAPTPLSPPAPLSPPIPLEIAALQEITSAPAVPPDVLPRNRLWLVTALVAFGLVALAIVTGFHPLVSRFFHRDTPAAIHSLAVLPLENLSGDPSQEYFADGMTDELITELARIPNLRVVSRTSVMAEKGSRRPLADIARQLNVDAVVEGSIVHSGDRIRITAQLIDARTDRHLWAQSFEGLASDVLALQDSVTQQIANQARLVFALPAPHAPVNPAAYDAYLRGRYFFNKQDFVHSIDYFHQAVSLDPTYATAFAGYASALEAATAYDIGTPEQLMPQALAAAQRAIQLDPQNGEAYTEFGSIQTIYTWDWTAAEQNLIRGISLSPSDPIAEFKYATYLEAVDNTHDAVTHMRRALQLDPLSFLINRRLGVALYYDRQYDAALAQLQRAAEMEQSTGTIEHYLSLIYEQKGDRDQALQHDQSARHERQPPLDSAALLNLSQQHEWLPYWRARNLVFAASHGNCAVYEIGLDDVRLNDLDQAFDSFQRAIDNHCFDMAFIRAVPLLDSIRHDPRYATLLTRIHQ